MKSKKLYLILFLTILILSILFVYNYTILIDEFDDNELYELESYDREDENKEIREFHSYRPNYSEQLIEAKAIIDIPDSMIIFNNYTLKLTITKAISDSVLIEELISNYFETRTIQVSTRVKANLIDPSSDSNFLITSLSSEKQLVDDESNTIWQWNVKPVDYGDNRLLLTISVVLFDEFGSVTKDHNIFDDKIFVEASTYLIAKEFIKNYWQYILSTIVIPLIGFGAKRLIKKAS